MGQFYNIDVFQLNLRNVEKRFCGFLLDISVSILYKIIKCSYQKHTERKKNLMGFFKVSVYTKQIQISVFKESFSVISQDENLKLFSQ